MASWLWLIKVNVGGTVEDRPSHGVDEHAERDNPKLMWVVLVHVASLCEYLD